MKVDQRISEQNIRQCLGSGAKCKYILVLLNSVCKDATNETFVAKMCPCFTESEHRVISKDTIFLQVSHEKKIEKVSGMTC